MVDVVLLAANLEVVSNEMTVYLHSTDIYK